MYSTIMFHFNMEMFPHQVEFSPLNGFSLGECALQDCMPRALAGTTNITTVARMPRYEAQDLR